MMILKKRAIGRLRLKKPLYFYIFTDENSVLLVNDEYPEFRIYGRTIDEAIRNLDMLILSLIFLYGTTMTITELFVGTYLLMGNAEYWRGGDVQGVRPHNE